MEFTFTLNNIRIAPRKTRQVVDVIRGKTVADARALLEFMVKRGADPILKLVNSGAASLFQQRGLEAQSLRIVRITVDGGPILKRSFPMSRGRAYPIMKRTSHITLVLGDGKPEVAVKKEATVKDTPAKETSPAKALTNKKVAAPKERARKPKA